MERAKVELDSLLQTDNQLQDLSEKRKQFMADCYLSGIEPDTRELDETIAHLEANELATAKRRKQLETVLEELSGRTLRLNHECWDLIGRIVPNIQYGDFDEVPF